jgi:hypothetical protein
MKKPKIKDRVSIIVYKWVDRLDKFYKRKPKYDKVEKTPQYIADHKWHKE